jgi:hypothetical protein
MCKIFRNVIARRCKSVGCDRLLRCQNKSGYCNKCINIISSRNYRLQKAQLSEMVIPKVVYSSPSGGWAVGNTKI